MQSILAVFALLSLLLIAKTSYARLGRGQYWHVMNGEAMPMIQLDLMDTRNSALSNKKINTEVAEDIVDEIVTVDESSDTIPELTMNDSQDLKGENSYVDESDPIPDTTMAW